MMMMVNIGIYSKINNIIIDIYLNVSKLPTALTCFFSISEVFIISTSLSNVVTSSISALNFILPSLFVITSIKYEKKLKKFNAYFFLREEI